MVRVDASRLRLSDCRCEAERGATPVAVATPDHVRDACRDRDQGDTLSLCVADRVGFGAPLPVIAPECVRVGTDDETDELVAGVGVPGRRSINAAVVDVVTEAVDWDEDGDRKETVEEAVTLRVAVSWTAGSGELVNVIVVGDRDVAVVSVSETVRLAIGTKECVGVVDAVRASVSVSLAPGSEDFVDVADVVEARVWVSLAPGSSDPVEVVDSVGVRVSMAPGRRENVTLIDSDQLADGVIGGWREDDAVRVDAASRDFDIDQRSVGVDDGVWLPDAADTIIPWEWCSNRAIPATSTATRRGLRHDSRCGDIAPNIATHTPISSTPVTTSRPLGPLPCNRGAVDGWKVIGAVSRREAPADL